ALNLDMPPKEWQVSEDGLQRIAKLRNLGVLLFYQFKPPNLEPLQNQLPECEIKFRDSDGELKVLEKRGTE
ncbi:MAG: hypothetical protein AAF664_22890, partial [Planctomycetota bacterium]